MHYNWKVILILLTLGLSLSTEATFLKVDKADITCQGKAYKGLRGTIIVPEDRDRRNSRRITLPVVVVKSLSPTPGYPIFQCAGGPGGSNISPERQSVKRI